MHLPEQQHYALPLSKLGTAMYGSSTVILMVNYGVAYQLVTSLGNYDIGRVK